MSRRSAAQAREILGDPKYHCKVISKFINVLMVDGKKSIAEKIVYDALKLVSKKAEARDGVAPEQVVFYKALENVCPSVEIKSKRLGGATYQIPVSVPESRRKALGFRYIVEAARKRGEKGMVLRLAGELADAFDLKGAAVKKREDVTKMAMANQAFASIVRH